MNVSLVRLWLSSLLSEFVEGCADAFLVTTGGATAAQAVGIVAAQPLSVKQTLCSVLIGGIWYVAAWIKKNPLPSLFVPKPEPTATS